MGAQEDLCIAMYPLGNGGEGRKKNVPVATSELVTSNVIKSLFH